MAKPDLQSFASDPAAFRAELVIPAGSGPARFGDVMAPFQRERFADLDPALQAVAVGRKPPIGRHWWEATKGASKDTDLACCLLWLMAFTPRALTCQVAAANQDQAAELRKAATSILSLNPWLAQLVRVHKFTLASTRQPAAAEIIPADVHGSHGARPDVLIVNELTHLPDGKREYAENLLDNATKVPFGLVVVATNAGFLGSWQFDWRENARTSDRWIFHQLAEPSPWLDEAELREAERRNSSTRYRRLWKGEWVTGTGDALDADDVERAVMLDGPSTAGGSHLACWASLDVGIRRDFSALVVLANDYREGVRKLAYAESWRPTESRDVDLDDVLRRIITLHASMRLNYVCYDPHQCEFLAQRLMKAGVPTLRWPATMANHTRMASSLIETFRDGVLALYADAELIEGLRSLAIVDRVGGYRLVPPEKRSRVHGHADKAIALAMGLAAVGIERVYPGGSPGGPSIVSVEDVLQQVRRVEAAEISIAALASTAGQVYGGNDAWR